MLTALYKKIQRKVKADGAASLFQAVSKNVKELASVPAFLAEARSVSKTDLEACLHVAFEAQGGLVRPLQVRSEILRALQMANQRKIRRVMEIGTAKGGTLFLHSKIAEPDALLVSVDLPGGQYGGGYVPWRRMLYKSFAREQQKIHLLQENSHALATKEKVRKVLGGEKLDLLFIDGDHSYEGVKQDFELYRDLVAPGGLIVLHDIAFSKDISSTVDRFWREIKDKYKSGEFIENPNQGWAGIGWVQMP